MTVDVLNALANAFEELATTPMPDPNKPTPIYVSRMHFEGWAAQLRRAIETHEAFGEWLCKQIDDADSAYRSCPCPDRAIRPLVLKQVASRHQAFLSNGNQQEEQCDESK